MVVRCGKITFIIGHVTKVEIVTTDGGQLRPGTSSSETFSLQNGEKKSSVMKTRLNFTGWIHTPEGVTIEFQYSVLSTDELSGRNKYEVENDV